MYISCFVGLCSMSGFSSHQTFILQKHICISREPAQLNLARATIPPSPSCYRFLRLFNVSVWLFSFPLLPEPPYIWLLLSFSKMFFCYSLLCFIAKSVPAAKYCLKNVDTMPTFGISEKVNEPISISMVNWLISLRLIFSCQYSVQAAELQHLNTDSRHKEDGDHNSRFSLKRSTSH